MRSDEFIADLIEWDKRIKAMPPVPWLLIARDDVPKGRIFRYYNTRAQMIVYCAKEDIDTLPRLRTGQHTSFFDLTITPLHGIPVVYE